MPIVRSRTLYLSPADDVQAAVRATMEAATVSLHVNAYAFTRADMATILTAKHQQGLEVGVVADASQSESPLQRALLQHLVDAGVSVVLATAPTGRINHEKAIMIDLALGPHHNGSHCMYGSYNWSETAPLQENHVQVDNDPNMCQFLYDQYCEARTYGLAHCSQLTPTLSPLPSP